MSTLVLAALLLAAPEAPAQPLIASDRPGFSYAAGVVPKHRWQTEIGVRGRFADAAGLDLPVASARFGLADGLELQIGLPALSVVEDGPDGLGNLALGFKAGAAPAQWLAYSLVGLLIAPTGDRALAETTWQGLAALNVELYFLENGWASLNTQLDTFTAADGDRALAVSPSAAFGWTIADAVNPFVQVVVRFADGEQHPLFGGGLAWLLTRQVQVDVSADYDVDSETTFVDAGFSVLW